MSARPALDEAIRGVRFVRCVPEVVITQIRRGAWVAGLWADDPDGTRPDAPTAVGAPACTIDAALDALDRECAWIWARQAAE